MKALIIVDAQIDFMPGGALEVSRGHEIVPVINRVLPKFELAVATQDWHPQNHKSFYTNHEGKSPFEEITLHGLAQVLWPNHCVQGTKGAEFHPQINMNPVEAIFRKGMNPEIDSYSGFYDNGRKVSTGLAGYLREKGATDLYFCGLAADICVYFTMMDALEEGFNVHLISDATKALDQSAFETQLNSFSSKGIRALYSSEL
ncbi:MAG: bifunctional nicotinamidase/pyrazinamidase [Cryomorphaceae bacterium]|nr:bifunctional nicotinamidase/pyrazinamidase [Cryomorphaceae bacterium]